MTEQPAAEPPRSVPLTPLVLCTPPAADPPPAPAEAGVVPALPLLIGGVPKPPSDASGVEHRVVLRFPDEPVGMVVLTKQDEGATYHSATGELPVPGGWSVQLNLADTVTDGAALAALDPNGVRVLTAQGLTDEGLAGLADYRSLVYLRLGNAVTDAGLARLRGLQTLTMLSVSSPGITDAAVPDLLALRELQSLHLDGCALTDAGVAALAQLPRLTSLSISSATLTNAAISALADMPALESLTLTSDLFDDAGLLTLASGFLSLKEARIHGVQLTTDGLMAAFAAGAKAQINGQWFSPKAVQRLRQKA